MKKCEDCDSCGGAKTYNNQVSMPLGGRVRCIDRCIHQIVAALNAGGVTTVACCCGHGEQDGRIDLEDGRVLRIETGTEEYECDWCYEYKPVDDFVQINEDGDSACKDCTIEMLSKQASSVPVDDIAQLIHDVLNQEFVSQHPSDVMGRELLRQALNAFPAPSEHRWDQAGERCVKCGAKDWMGGPCV